MAQEVRQFSVTVPHGTPQASPATFSLAMPARVVRKVRVRIPPGPQGTVGWALASAGTPILPWNAGAFVVANDEAIEWELAGQIDSGAWQLIAYNVGVFDHTLYVTFQLDLPGGQLAAVSAPIAIPAPGQEVIQ